MRRLPRSVLAVLVTAALGAAGCNPGGPDTIELTAAFDDVGDLVTNAHVRAGDVPIGLVTGIELGADHRAIVTMQVKRDTGLPARTEAALDRTSLLGERYIDLRPLEEGGVLAHGDHLEDARVVTDFEDLVSSGDRVLSLVATDQLQAAIETGAVAFGGRGGLLGQFITDVEGFVGTYNEDRDDLLVMIDALDRLATTMAPDAELNAEALAVLEDASRVLEEEDERLLDALVDLTELSVTGGRIMSQHREETEDAIRRLRILLEQFTAVDGALADLLTWLPRHNLHVPNGVVLEQGSQRHMAQVWLDFVVCGVNDTPGDPARACDPPNPGQPSPYPSERPRSEACYDDLEVCREETDAENRR
ncbi:MCE family protein [Egicoccus sp. AB-alg2]|uniref:MCE family protein n=1 Tax=Egicoccus sp. AB-alg2 TaxID=3242693 RepID=UPI00359E108B